MKERITQYLTNKNLKADISTNNNFRDFELFKVPFYKEHFLCVTSLFVLNSIIFNLFKVPIRALVMLVTSLRIQLTQSEIKLMQYYILKTTILISSIVSYEVSFLKSLLVNAKWICSQSNRCQRNINQRNEAFFVYENFRGTVITIAIILLAAYSTCV